MSEENWSIRPQEKTETVQEGERPDGEAAAAAVAPFEEAMKVLSEEYPDAKELPQEVAAAILEGEEPSLAYLQYENQQLRVQLAGEQRDRENRERALGSALGGAEGGESDPFLSGFDAAFQD